MKRGHSNVVYLSEMKPYPTNPDRWLIQVEGGASVDRVKELPPLALSREEWENIGRRAGWMK